jgi:hypothetical protein
MLAAQLEISKYHWKFITGVLTAVEHCWTIASLKLNMQTRKTAELYIKFKKGKNKMSEKMDTWTVTVNCTVFAGDMDKDSVIAEAERVLTDITDGTDIAGFVVVDAKRDEF